ncbi:uncharacterized protein LOC114077943 [Solanum pennellii]|uniref:Uncharacterized protein LOC114077943 n=1 Tax=Solanum pennellii TaxID=28526 RepID=A0ABM1VEH8_SOLPN|nr:uncharacterized protein LOC114077943 [Solanum pennellii]
MATTTRPGVPKSEAVSKGYNFASTWEQNAPLTVQQQAAIQALSHAVAKRPFPSNLDQVSGHDNSLSVSTKLSSLEDSGAIEAVLVNTNQLPFLKAWRVQMPCQTASPNDGGYLPTWRNRPCSPGQPRAKRQNLCKQSAMWQ